MAPVDLGTQALETGAVRQWDLADVLKFWLETPGRLLSSPVEPWPDGDALAWLRAETPGEVYDRIKEPKAGRSKPRGARSFDEIDGETWHQTAVGPGHLGHKSILKIPAHDVIDHEAGIHLLWDPRVKLWTSHALNADTIGHEVDCRAAGVYGNPKTVWLSRKEKAAGKVAEDVLREATDEQMQAGVALSGYYQRLLGKRLVQWAHRQSHKSRTTDPGSRIYQGVILQLDLPHYPDQTRGSGKPIDDRWRL